MVLKHQKTTPLLILTAVAPLESISITTDSDANTNPTEVYNNASAKFFYLISWLSRSISTGVPRSHGQP
jgi:hypothetical protein